MRSPEPKRRVTLQDIAQRLSISHPTVSRALREDPRISISTRRKVQIMARKLSYRPDPMLSALAEYRRNNLKTPIAAELAWINLWQDSKALRAFREFDLYWKGAAQEAEKSGFRLEEFNLVTPMTAARLEKILLSRNIRGILIPPHGGFATDWSNFHWDNFCIVRFGHSVQTPRAHIVTSDQVTDGLLAYENIWNRGYRRIGLITSIKTHTRFSAGFFFGQMRSGTCPKLPMLLLRGILQKEDEQQLKSWLRQNKPDAILTDVCELPGMLKGIGCKIPKDVGLAVLSVLDGNADAGIDQNSEEIGRVAIQLVISLMNHNECGIPAVCREVLVEGHWIDGSTLPTRLAP